MAGCAGGVTRHRRVAAVERMAQVVDGEIAALDQHDDLPRGHALEVLAGVDPGGITGGAPVQFREHHATLRGGDERWGRGECRGRGLRRRVWGAGFHVWVHVRMARFYGLGDSVLGQRIGALHQHLWTCRGVGTGVAAAVSGVHVALHCQLLDFVDALSTS